VEDGHEPPDYYFSISGVRYGVEVTWLAEMAATATKVLPVRGLEKGIESWLSRIERDARQSGKLQGTYIIVFDYETLAEVSEHRAAAGKALSAFLAKTKALQSTEFDRLFGGLIGIQKLSGQGAHCYSAFIGGDWEVNVQHKVLGLLKSALERKRLQLGHLGMPCILVLLAGYHLGLPRHYQTALDALGDQFFHGIYLIYGEQCYPLRPIPA